MFEGAPERREKETSDKGYTFTDLLEPEIDRLLDVNRHSNNDGGTDEGRDETPQAEQPRTPADENNSLQQAA